MIFYYYRTTLARWRAAHLDNVKEKERRPYLATECDNLQKAEKFRRQIIGEVSRKVAQIQNGKLIRHYRGRLHNVLSILNYITLLSIV